MTSERIAQEQRGEKSAIHTIISAAAQIVALPFDDDERINRHDVITHVLAIREAAYKSAKELARTTTALHEILNLIDGCQDINDYGGPNIFMRIEAAANDALGQCK